MNISSAHSCHDEDTESVQESKVLDLEHHRKEEPCYWDGNEDFLGKEKEGGNQNKESVSYMVSFASLSDRPNKFDYHLPKGQYSIGTKIRY